MNHDAYEPHLEVVEYRGFRLVVRQTPLDWVVFIPLGGHRDVVFDHDRESAIALATAWIDENLPSEIKAAS